MIRLFEIALLLAPLLAVIAWRIWAPGKAPTVAAIAAAGAALVLLVGGMVWLRFQDAEPPDAVYIPSHIENGVVVPERRAP
jgi:hypothetical protein